MAIKDDNKKILDFDLQMEDQDQSFPMLQVLNNDGEIVDEDALKRAGLSDDQMVELMKQMVFSRILHERSSKLSKQGRFRFHGTRKFPIVVRSPYGGGTKTPEMHADSLEGLMAQTPGLRVVMQATPADEKGLLLSSIESDDPVIFLENLRLYRSIRGEVPEGYYTTPLDKANVVREGKDVTVVTYGGMVHTSLAAAEDLAKEGIDVEVIDLRTVSPLDLDTIGKSIEKTGRVVVAQEAQRQAGIGAMVMSEISERFIMSLDAPIGRVAAPDSVYPFALAENEWLPKEDDVIDKIKEVVNFD